MTGPSWYDVLGVRRDADAEQIRAAWRAAIADLDPGDRRFQVCNQAAEVLLDPERRAAHDAELDAATPEPVVEPASRQASGVETPAPEKQPQPRRVVPTWLLIGLALLAVLLTAASAWVSTTPSDQELEEASSEAQKAAEQAAVAILAYDYRRLPESRETAEEHLTSPYDEEYDRFFSVIEENAPSMKTVVEAEVVASGVVRTGEDRVQVLVFVDRPTTNAQVTEPVVYRDQVTLTMVEKGEEWLVSDMVTTPTQQ